MDIAAIKTLEQRYQRLVDDFQAGRIDDATFISQVDQLQFQDDYGRFWMVGTQTGSWHYYDGRTWHQADPLEADSLPFMDEEGRYWQRGVKSGDWYYHSPETGEWVKPEPGDGPAPPAMFGEVYDQGQQPDFAPYHTRLQQQNVDTGPGMPTQLDGELYQDDEGRYWALGNKSGQWYYYDHDGWHPAHEFQRTAAPQYQSYYQPQPPPAAAGYYGSSAYQMPPAYQPNQGYGYGPQPYPVQEPQAYPAQPQQPPQNYARPPQEGYVAQPPPQPQPARPQTEGAQTAPSDPTPGQMPTPPQGDSESGSWYYFNGQQWLKYSTGEPDETPPPAPKMVIDQEPKSAKGAEPPQVKVESKSEPMMAEVIEEEEPPVEVVDVEVITVIEPEPEPVEPAAPEPKPEPAAPQSPTVYASSSASSMTDEVIPRRSSRPVKVTRDPHPSTPAEQAVQPRRPARQRTTTDSGRPVAPRKKEAAHEPTIIIPTGATASKISSPTTSASRRDTQPVKPAPTGRERRARENTLPMETFPAQGGSSPAPSTGQRRREMTQPMPKIPSTATPRSGTVPMKPAVTTPTAKQAAQPKESAAASTAAARQLAQPQQEEEGYTFGDVLRSLPSTIWTFVGGVVLLLACAIGLIFTWGWLQGGNDLSSTGLAALQSPTPTLEAGPPDATPTPGPTPTTAPDLETSPTPFSLTTFTSAALGIAVEYPDAWKNAEEDNFVIFSGSDKGLDPENLETAAIWIGIPDDNSTDIADLLTQVLSNFPPDAETLNEGTISIASQTWTSAQIRYADEDLPGGQGIATLAVTNKDGQGYYLVAAAPAEEWNATQPTFQGMINSFRFATEEDLLAQATQTSGGSEAAAGDSSEGSAAGTRTATRQSSGPTSTPTPKASATPVTYIIQSGDTPGGIAQQFGVDVDLLLSENNITDPQSLQLGQELTIPFTAEQLEAYNASGSAAPATTGGASATDQTGDDQKDGAAESSASTTDASGPATTSAAKPAPTSDTAPSAVSGRIAYGAFNPGTNSYDLWLADVATGEQSIIAGEASQPAFNRDGSLLAYRSWALDSRGIFFRDFVGGRGGQVTRFVEDGLPTWAPDGYSFAFASRREGDRVPRIYIGNQLGEDSYSVGFQGEYPATFPDGRLIVKGCTPSGDCGIYTMGATGGGENKIGGPEDTAPAVSPDGSKIAFMSSGRGATNWEIWTMNPDGTGSQRLTDNGSNDGLPAWSPDGKSIAYVADQGGSWAVWVMNADGSNQRKLFNMKGSPDGSVLRDKDNSKGWLEERITWAP